MAVAVVVVVAHLAEVAAVLSGLKKNVAVEAVAVAVGVAELVESVQPDGARTVQSAQSRHAATMSKGGASWKRVSPSKNKT